MCFMFTDLNRGMIQKLVSALVSPCGNQTCESRMCGVRNNKLWLSNRSAEPNYTHQNLQSEAAKPPRLPTSAHMIRISSMPGICLKSCQNNLRQQICYSHSALLNKTSAVCEEPFYFAEISFSCCQINSKLQAAALHWPECVSSEHFWKKKPHEDLHFIEYSTPLHGINQYLSPGVRRTQMRESIDMWK